MSRCGLLNVGNTCFLNTAVQILVHTEPLTELLNRGGTANMNLPDTVLLHEFNALRQAMMRGPIVDPQRFVKAVKLVANFKHIDMDPAEQNDVAEFMLFLLDCFHNSLKCASKATHTHPPISNASNAALVAIKQKRDTDYSELVDIFNGIHISTVSSKLNATTSHRAEPYLMLDLPVDGHTLHDCIDAFLSTEHIDGWRNDATGANEPAEKRSSLWSLPPILVFVLKRFCPITRRKNDRHIIFPLEHLDMQQYVPGAYKYQCYAVANHMGSTNMGHYSAFIRSPIGASPFGWLGYDDAAIRPLSGPTDVITPHAYCLFYKQIP